VTVRLALKQAEELVRGALLRSATLEPNAASVARALVEAEALGQAGHGLRRVEAYAAQARAGKVDGRAQPTAERRAVSVLAIDAANGFAYPALDLAVEALPGIAREAGAAAAAIRRSHHAGVTGLPVERLAEAGLVALLFSNAPGAMAPWGGRRALFGTNPIAFACPLPGAAPIVIDLSLSEVARGRIMAARQKGEAIPEGWAFDREGRPTTDAGQALAGTMAPMGGAKGATLALMVELLAAGLTGANYAYQASSFFDAEGPPPGIGHLILALDPERIGGEGVLERFATLAQAIEADQGARLPGRRRQALRERAREHGLELDEALVAAIRSIGSRSCETG